MCARCFSRCESPPSPELFYWMRRESSQEGDHKIAKAEEAVSGCAELAVSGMPMRQNVNVTSSHSPTSCQGNVIILPFPSKCLTIALDW